MLSYNWQQSKRGPGIQRAETLTVEDRVVVRKIAPQESKFALCILRVTKLQSHPRVTTLRVRVGVRARVRVGVRARVMDPGI